MEAVPNPKLERALRQLETSTSWGLLKPGNDERRAAMIALGKDWSARIHSSYEPEPEPEPAPEPEYGRPDRCAASDSERNAAAALVMFAEALCVSLEAQGVQ
jgi:hypothetical protein